MKLILEKILDQVMKNGLAFTLLALATYVYWTQNNRLQVKIQSCNDQIIEIYKEQNQQLIDVLDRNTEVMENLSVLLKNQ